MLLWKRWKGLHHPHLKFWVEKQKILRLMKMRKNFIYIALSFRLTLAYFLSENDFSTDCMLGATRLKITVNSVCLDDHVLESVINSLNQGWNAVCFFSESLFIKVKTTKKVSSVKYLTESSQHHKRLAEGKEWLEKTIYKKSRVYIF